MEMARVAAAEEEQQLEQQQIDHNDDDDDDDYAWLRAASDVYRSTDGNNGERQAARDGAHSPGLPACARRCADGDLYHRVLGAWCVHWSDVPLEDFLRAWYALPRADRRAMLAERIAFAAELDADRWPQNMLDRDDVTMLAALPPAALSELSELKPFGSGNDGGNDSSVTAWLAVEAVERGAQRCLAWLARDWPPGRWPVIAPPHVAVLAGYENCCENCCDDCCCCCDGECDVLDNSGSGWACRTAAQNGHEAVLRMLRERGGCACGAAAIEAAARAGRAGCLVYLLAADCGPLERRFCVAAARGGHANCLRLLLARGCDWAPAEVLAAAAEAGSAACIEAALEDLAAAEADKDDDEPEQQDDPLDHHQLDRRWAASLRRHAAALGGAAALCALTARAGAPAALRLLRERAGASWAANTCANAAFGGHLECLRLAHLGGCAWDETASASAAESGSLDCMRYAHEHGCPWAPRAPALAAGRGHLDCMSYARAHGCPWDATAVCAEAAFAGQLSCLRFALDHAPLPGAAACAWAAAGGHLSCLQLLRARGCPWDRADCLARAARPSPIAADAADADSALVAWIEQQQHSDD